MLRLNIEGIPVAASRVYTTALWLAALWVRIPAIVSTTIAAS
jgi:hypothetical protein